MDKDFVMNAQEKCRTFYSISEMEQYAEETNSTLLHAQLLFLNSFQIDHVASHIGKANGIVNILRSAPFLAKNGFDPGIPLELLAKVKIINYYLCITKLGGSHSRSHNEFSAGGMGSCNQGLCI